MTENKSGFVANIAFSEGFSFRKLISFLSSLYPRGIFHFSKASLIIEPDLVETLPESDEKNSYRGRFSNLCHSKIFIDAKQFVSFEVKEDFSVGLDLISIKKGLANTGRRDCFEIRVKKQENKENKDSSDSSDTVKSGSDQAIYQVFLYLLPFGSTDQEQIKYLEPKPVKLDKTFKIPDCKDFVCNIQLSNFCKNASQMQSSGSDYIEIIVYSNGISMNGFKWTVLTPIFSVLFGKRSETTVNTTKIPMPLLKAMTQFVSISPKSANLAVYSKNGLIKLELAIGCYGKLSVFVRGVEDIDQLKMTKSRKGRKPLFTGTNNYAEGIELNNTDEHDPEDFS